MNKRITSEQDKIDLVARLVKEGAIDFTEAIKLLEVEVEYLSGQLQNIPNNPLAPYNRFKRTWETSVPLWLVQNPPSITYSAQ